VNNGSRAGRICLLGRDDNLGNERILINN